ncbi:MAG: RNA polymerase sigma factor [Gemmatimonadota bacterium]|nr:RNA polymerase sigma factor [Gemmatimonadota bacterium]
MPTAKDGDPGRGKLLAASLAVEPTTAARDAGDVARAATGDRRAFEALYRANVGRIFSLCVRMCGDRAGAEELTQDVFVRAWEKLPLFRGESAFSTWLHRLAVNVVLNARKSAGRERSRREDDDDGNGVAALPARAREHHAERLDLEAAIATLPPGAKRVFVLHDVEGYKHEEIAEMLGVTAGGSKAQLHRARLLLREALAR